MKLILKNNTWYACKFIGDEFIGDATFSDDQPGGYSFSPIKIGQFTPLKTGNGIFELSFFHWNYPSGVQDKIYTLKKIAHGEEFILATSTEHCPTRTLMIKQLTKTWINLHFPTINFPEDMLREL
jgi:hypothetical protein